MVCPGECSVCTWEECSAAIGWHALYTSVRCILSVMFSKLLFPYWFSVWMIYPLLKVRYWSPLLLLYCCLLLLLVVLIRALCFRCFIVGCICIYNCYIRLKNRPVFHYISTFSVSGDRFGQKVYFVWYECSCSFCL